MSGRAALIGRPAATLLRPTPRTPRTLRCLYARSDAAAIQISTADKRYYKRLNVEGAIDLNAPAPASFYALLGLETLLDPKAKGEAYSKNISPEELKQAYRCALACI